VLNLKNRSCLLVLSFIWWITVSHFVSYMLLSAYYLGLLAYINRIVTTQQTCLRTLIVVGGSAVGLPSIVAIVIGNVDVVDPASSSSFSGRIVTDAERLADFYRPATSLCGQVPKTPHAVYRLTSQLPFWPDTLSHCRVCGSDILAQSANCSENFWTGLYICLL